MAFSLQQFSPIFELRDREGNPYVLIGGQAVNYWAEKYVSHESTLSAWLPFTSEDIDFHGVRDDVLRTAKYLGVRARLPHKKEMTALAGIVPFNIEDMASAVDFVRSIPTVPTHKIRSWALTAERDGKTIRVLDPVSLLYCKTYLAVKVDQTNRRDVDHLRIMVICVRAFLRETLSGVEANDLPARGWLGALERVLKLAETSLGRKAASKLSISWAHALPEDEIHSSTHPAAVQVRQKRLPQWRRKLGLPSKAV